MRLSLTLFLPIIFWNAAALAENETDEPFLPFVFHVGYDDGWVLQGSFPTAAQRKAVEQAAAEAIEDGEIASFLRVSSDTIPEPWIGRVPELVGSFIAGAAKGVDLCIVDGKLIVQGETDEAESHEKLSSLLRKTVPEALAFDDRMTVDGKRMVEPVYYGPATVAETNEPAEEPAEKPITMTASVLPALVSTVENTPTEAKKPEPEQGPPPASDLPSDEVEKEEAKKPVASGDIGPDPGGPVLFFFDVASAEIRSEDRHKIDWIIDRCGDSRTIVYITGHADYRGSYALNRKLTLQRTEAVRDAIFAGDVAEDLTAELTAKGDDQSESQDAWRSTDSEKALQYRRRVVVETYRVR